MNRTLPTGFTMIDKAEDGFACVGSFVGHLTLGLQVVASWGEGWEHVSVSRRDRCPSWEEMEHVARLFWPNETAMQLHVPASDHINVHPFCLHWWRPIGVEIPMPPGWMVA